MDPVSPHSPLLRVNAPVVFAGALGVLCVVLRLCSPGLPEGGDDVMHYLHARYFWTHAQAALSEWGKPVFSLLASPFAQVGQWGMTVFSASCAVATCALMMAWSGTIPRMGWGWLMVPMLMLTPIYFHSVVRGLTEALFGLWTCATILLLWRRRHVAGMALASFFPFVRPEYIVFVPLVAGWVAWRRDFRALPWAGLGLALYVLCCGLFLGDPFIFFRNSTYVGNTLYGRGSAWLFVENIDAMYGLPLKRAFLVSALLLPLVIWRDPTRRGQHLFVLSMTFLPALLIFAIHSYAWWQGGRASLGLLRVIATTVPLVVLFTVHTLASAWDLWMPTKRWTTIAFVALVLFYANTGYHELVHRQEIPVRAKPVHQVQQEAALFVNTINLSGERVFFADPSIALLCELDPWNPESATFMSGGQGERAYAHIERGDLMVWDQQFSAGEGALPLEHLFNDERLHLEKEFISESGPGMSALDVRRIYVFRCVE